MISALSDIPVRSRRRLAATLGPFAILFAAVGAVATTGNPPGAVRVFSAIAFLVAALLGAAAWRVARGVRIDLAHQRLDGAIEDVVAARGGKRTGSAHGCRHDHDADEMQVRTDRCAHDGTGTDCEHSCDGCVLASARPAPARGERPAP